MQVSPGRWQAVSTALYDEYFGRAEMNVAGMSSHWRSFAPRSSVRTDASGVPVDAVGVGFGGMNSRQAGDAVFTALAAVLHGARHPARRRLLSALALTRSTTTRAGLVFNQDALRQAFTLALLAARLHDQPIRRVLLIGDGYGVLGAALAQTYPDAQIVFVDLGRSLLFQAMTVGRVLPQAAVALVGVDDPVTVESSRFVFCPSDRIAEWEIRPVDLAVNIASMQEMSADVVAGYFQLLRRSATRWFYCCNRERKVMPEGEVSAFAEYPWAAGDRHVIDGACPWHQWFVAPHRGKGLLPVSLIARYDGPHLHRLTRLAPQDR
jgi:hypothetical protein